MKLSRTTLAFAAATVFATGLTVSLGAQMSGGQMGGSQTGGGQMTGHDHGAMQGSMSAGMSSDQTMRNIDSMMANVSSMMKDFTAMQPGTFGPRHDQMMSSIQGLVGQMHQVHAAMGDMAKNPGMTANSAAMKSFQQAGAEFQKMGTATQALMKSLGQAAKAMPNAHK
jgi:ElaB/YqjD/DUF883 family membrane-anchored ribosome-binding protein